ncbi:MAG: DUF692 domain-containing protein [Rhodospirillaceae bacterium]|nr:DUF692 domain-containing protein [Rhodospirillaceae bacterium]
MFDAADIARTERGLIPPTCGIGLRFQHHEAVAAGRPQISWFEVHTENYLGGGKVLGYLDTIRRDYPLSLHGVGLSLGSADDLDATHLARVVALIKRTGPVLVSEHLSWSAVGGVYLADLLPLPLTEEALSVICRNVDRLQSALQREILLENPSSYLRYSHSTIPEWEFLSAVSRRTGCGILCDVNNIFVSSMNHGWNALDYLSALPVDRVGEIHLAGHTLRVVDGEHEIRIDDHGSAVAPEVWSLYEHALQRFGATPTLIEWDTNVPALDVLMAEAAKAEKKLQRVWRRAGHASVA